MDITPIETSTGNGFSIYAIVIIGVCQVIEFIEKSDKLNQKQIINLFQLITKSGLPHNERRFNGLGEGIFELKTRGGLRITCFTGGPLLLKSLVLAEAFHKPRKKILTRKITKALELKKSYFQQALKIV